MSSKSARHPEASSRQVVWPLCLLALAALLPATFASPVPEPNPQYQADYHSYDYPTGGSGFHDYGEGASASAHGSGSLGGGAWGHVDPSGGWSESHSFGYGR